jgi:Tfp pilus assembly protein PilF
LGILSLVAFAPAVGNGFVTAWDDNANLVENPHFRGLGWAQFAWAWRAHVIGVYQPFAWLLFSAESAAWDLEPWGYHLTSLVLHAANTVAMFLLTSELLALSNPELTARDRTIGAAAAASLWGSHPLRVEVVAWASCQPYLPCTLFSLLSLRAYLHAHAGASRRRRLLVRCWFLMLAAMLCKATAVMLPLVLPILDFYPLRRAQQDRDRDRDRPPSPWYRVPDAWREKLPFLGLGAVFIVANLLASWWSLGSSGRPHSLSSRVAQACYGILYYPLATIAPTGLMPFHPSPGRLDLAEGKFLACALAVIALSVGLFRWRWRHPGIFAAWASYLVQLAPNLGLVHLGPMLVADRYSYSTTIGGFVLVGAGIASLLDRTRRKAPRFALLIAGVTLLLTLIPLTWRQCRVWHDSEAMWQFCRGRFSDAVRSDPTSADAHHNLGVACYYLGDYREAEVHLRSALKREPGSARSHGSLGAVLVGEGRYAEAIAEMSEAVRLDREPSEYRDGLATVLTHQGRLDDARAVYEEAIRLEPNVAKWHAGLGEVLYRQGRLGEAATELSQAARLNPDDSQTREILRRIPQEPLRANPAGNRNRAL